MALIECIECKNKISDKSKACPNCGFPTAQADSIVECPECSQRVSNKSKDCSNCGFPIDKNNQTDNPQKVKRSQNTKSQKKNKLGITDIITGIVAIGLASYGLTQCAQTTGDIQQEAEVNYQHYIGGNYATMEQCLNHIKQEAKNSGKTLEIQSDKPDRVAGRFDNKSEAFFYCEKKETGSRGTFFEAAYPVFN